MKSKIQTLIGAVVLFGGLILIGLVFKAVVGFFFIPHEPGNFETDFRDFETNFQDGQPEGTNVFANILNFGFWTWLVLTVISIISYAIDNRQTSQENGFLNPIGHIMASSAVFTILIIVYLLIFGGCGRYKVPPEQFVEAQKFSLGNEMARAIDTDLPRAAEQGDSLAQRNLGKGVPEDDVEAVKRYRKADEQGDAEAQHNLGTCYYNGEGVPQDYAEAAKWYRMAAEQGFALAQYNLGTCYDNGEGVPQDSAEAVKWYRLAADQGL
ncbi:sel1 repeat family protein, partial [Verrucomicrobiales bacterium]|nr:sel1 repeat family protein [Verrucomicrobiales bacterium]